MRHRLKRKIDKHEFWVTNTSMKYDVSLSDLRLTIRRGESRNLLDSRHYTYTAEQLEKSAQNGSIKKKSSVISVRRIAPDLPVKMLLEVDKTKVPLKPLRHNIEVHLPEYEEFQFVDEDNLSDEEKRRIEEEYAAEMADADFSDRQPILPVDKVYADE